ncbi:ATP-dependent RecD-like DNA helicase [uncultured Finegoldia sp.]|uniref:SF1B family DNA helicase RecD2 n=1 Tax=uncultured Finegoldia sp. TaxID=328009 RepID=UPI00261F9FD8|nr:ATP-dependent RecD-like DNA helicase [uncultured Finegoldia sp.]
MKFSATVKHIIFENDSNGFRIFSCDKDGEDIIVKGNSFKIMPGDFLDIEANKVLDRKYGEQYNIVTVERSNKPSLYNIFNYLKSGLIKGIGETTARNIVDKFGEDTMDILKNSPSKLTEVKGIGKKNYKKIKESLDEKKDYAEIFLYLQSLGLSLHQSNIISDYYKEDTKKIITQNPYVLIDDIRGIGFKTADIIAQRIDIAPDSPFRIKAAFKYYMEMEANSNGNCYVLEDDLINGIEKLLNIEFENKSDTLEMLVVNGVIAIDHTDDEKRVYLPKIEKSEMRCALNISNILKTEIEDEFDVEGELSNLKNSGLDELQLEAIKKSMTEKMLIITGGPGTGKTTIINNITKIFKKNDKEIILAAPTGRAAKRLSESCNEEAKTIHRILGYIPVNDGMVFEHDEDNPIDCDLIIIDEASMMDIFIADSLFRALDSTTRVVFVGDCDQLPSVQAGNVLNDLIESGNIVTIKLKKIFRQAQNSNIIVNAHRINNGEFPILNEKNKDFFFIEEDNPENVKKTILDLCAQRLPNFYKKDEFDDIIVLTPMKKSSCGTKELNTALQEVLNPQTPATDEIEQADRIFRLNDKVMQIKNDYSKEFIDDDSTGVFNGDIGRITYVDPIDESIDVLFDDKTASFTKKECDGLTLSYAITIHKSQGSEFPIVVIPVTQAPFMLLTRNLLYTAITRAKEIVVLVGSLKILRQMISNNKIMKRNSGLDKRIREYMNVHVDSSEQDMMREMFEDEEF